MQLSLCGFQDHLLGPRRSLKESVRFSSLQLGGELIFKWFGCQSLRLVAEPPAGCARDVKSEQAGEFSDLCGVVQSLLVTCSFCTSAAGNHSVRLEVSRVARGEEWHSFFSVIMTEKEKDMLSRCAWDGDIHSFQDYIRRVRLTYEKTRRRRRKLLDQNWLANFLVVLGSLKR